MTVRVMTVRILPPLLALLAPAGAAAQQLPTLVVPAETEVAIAARGMPQPRLAPRSAATASPPSAVGWTQSSLFEPPDEPGLAATGQSLLSAAAAAALAATFGTGGGRGATAAPARTR
jgi:hypothetical protein